MILQECLDKLARGKLSNLPVSINGTIKAEHLPKVVDAINEALERIYTDLPVKEKSVIIELYEGRTDYPLDSSHSFRFYKDDIYAPYDYFIRDTEANPFEDDVLTVMEVWDDLDRKLPINDPEDPLAIGISEDGVISVNYAISSRILNVIYRAKHKFLTVSDTNNKVDLPSNLYGALFSYVAYLVHSDMNTELAVSNAQKYFQEYKMVIDSVIQNSTLNPNKLVLDSKFRERGWV